jgi:hypothetical protein
MNLDKPHDIAAIHQIIKPFLLLDVIIKSKMIVREDRDITFRFEAKGFLEDTDSSYSFSLGILGTGGFIVQLTGGMFKGGEESHYLEMKDPTTEKDEPSAMEDVKDGVDQDTMMDIDGRMSRMENMRRMRKMKRTMNMGKVRTTRKMRRM